MHAMIYFCLPLRIGALHMCDTAAADSTGKAAAAPCCDARLRITGLQREAVAKRNDLQLQQHELCRVTATGNWRAARRACMAEA